MGIDRPFILGLKRSGKYSCPSCQHERTKNKRDTPLSVTVESDGVLYFCHHCNQSGVEHYEENKQQYNTIRKQKRDNRTDVKKLEVRKRHGTVW